jgi:hypothetical protein
MNTGFFTLKSVWEYEDAAHACFEGINSYILHNFNVEICSKINRMITGFAVLEIG